QQTICCLGPLWMALVTLGKRNYRFGVVPARVICLAKPVLGASSQPVVRMLSDEALQGCFGSRIVCLLQQTESEIILLRSRTSWQPARRRRTEGTTGSCVLQFGR